MGNRIGKESRRDQDKKEKHLSNLRLDAVGLDAPWGPMIPEGSSAAAETDLEQALVEGVTQISIAGKHVEEGNKMWI